MNLDGVEHTVFIRDQAENDNDADLTNDGFYVKVGEGKTRYISKDEARGGVDIDGTPYRFNIVYGKGN